MTTTAAALSNIASAVATLTSATRAVSDYVDSLEQVTANTTLYQLRGIPVGKSPDSNVSETIMGIEVEMHHYRRLTERTGHTEAALQTWAVSFADRAWWRAITGIAEILEGPDASVSREGNIISSAFTVRVTIDTA